MHKNLGNKEVSEKAGGKWYAITIKQGAIHRVEANAFEEEIEKCKEMLEIRARGIYLFSDLPPSI